MSISLRVLIVGDEAFGSSVLSALRSFGDAPTVRDVRTQGSFEAALSPDLDLILIDHDLEQFDSHKALSVLSERRLDAPALVVADAPADDLAVKLVALGAADCIRKQDEARLVPAITAALRLRKLRAAQRDAELKLHEIERRHRLLIDRSPASNQNITDAADQANSEESDSRFTNVQQGILNALPDAVALLNHEGTILSVNDPWQTFSSRNGGDDAHTGVGVNYFEACGEEGRDVIAGICDVISGRSPFFEKEYSCHSPTQKRWFRLLVRPLRLPEGPGAVVIHVDITDRHPVDEAIARGEQRYRSLVQANSSIVWSTDADGSVTREFSKWQQITGQTFEEYRGDGWSRAVHPDDLDRVIAVWRECLANPKPLEIEYRLRTANGTYRDFIVRGVPVTDANGLLREWVGTHCDITDRKRSEKFERERNHLRDALTAHERVLGVVGHELRTPLAATRAMVECLLSADQATITPQEELVCSIHQQVLKMSTMLNDLLEIAGMNSGTIRWNWGTVDVSRACADAIDMIRAGADRPRVELNLTLDPQDIIMRGDAEAIRRLVLNLVGNACKFTEKGSVNVCVTAVKEDGRDWVQIEVIDTGVGMSESTASRVGEPFALSGGVMGNDHINGAGLGLAICRGIAAAHGGRIWLQSQVGVGTHITVQLRPDLTEPSTAAQAALFIRQSEPHTVGT